MNKSVMSVDDEPEIGKMLKKILGKQDYTVTTVQSGADCIKELQKGFKGILLMDVKMPAMTGWDTIREIVRLKLNKNIVIIMVSGVCALEESVEDLQEYVTDYVTKPFNIDELKNKVSLYMNYMKAPDK